jgi:hypothetical protein
LCQGFGTYFLNPESLTDRDEGTFEKDLINGNGKRFFKNGDIYEGAFAEDLFDGLGEIIYSKDDKNGAEKLVGNFKAGLTNGNGTLTWTNGSKYVGNFDNGIRTGYGIHFYNRNSLIDRDEGYHVKGNVHGHGTRYYKNGTKEQGTFVDDTFVQSYIVYKDI